MKAFKMPTINQLIRKPRVQVKERNTAPALHVENQPDAGSLNRPTDGREVIRDGRSIAVLEIADGRKPDASSASEFLLRPSQPPTGGSALFRAHAPINRRFFSYVNEIA